MKPLEIKCSKCKGQMVVHYQEWQDVTTLSYNCVYCDAKINHKGKVMMGLF